MINTEAVDSMLEELDRCQEEISILEHNISRVKYAQAENLTHTDEAIDCFTNEVIEILEDLLEQEKTAARFIHDLLAFEYEHLEVNPILKQLHI